jgi:hypothetical protein
MAKKRKRTRWDIEVTAEDIEKAHRNDSYRCVLAQAIARQVPGARNIDVDLRTIRWSDDAGRHVFLTPYTAAGYVVAFDAGDELEPFSVHLRDAVPSLQNSELTPIAREKKITRDKLRRERQREQTARAVVADPASTAPQRAVAEERIGEAPERIAQAQASHEKAKAEQAATPGPHRGRVSEATRKAPKRVFRTKERHYGHRVLRVNQEEGRKHYA